MILKLIVPGVPDVLSVNAGKRFARLEKWSARAVPAVSQHQCYEQALLAAFGLSNLEYGNLPTAQCTWLTDFDESAPIYCCRADPVHLKTDKDHARLIPVESLDLQADESRELVSALNEHFAQDELRFSIGQKGRWYLSGVQAVAPDTQPTSQVAGRNVAAFLCASPETARWRQLGIEAQMLLHSHPVNQARENRGLPPVNALWFWGAGKLPAQVSAQECKVYSNAAFAIGAGKLVGMRVYPLEEVRAGLPKTLLQPGKRSVLHNSSVAAVIVLDTRLLEAILSGDQGAQLSVLSELDQGMFKEAEQLLLRGRLSQVQLDTCDGQALVLSRPNLLCFWKKARPLTAG